MRIRSAIVLAFACLLTAQRPPAESPDSFVADMMAFDSNHDGRLSRSEISDSRLLRLFDRADSNHDGFVTPEELLNLSRKESAEFVPNRGGPGGPPMRMGQLIPEPMQRSLDLTEDQKTKLAALQSRIDSELKLILTDQQRERLNNFDPRGPGGPGGPGRGAFRNGPPGPRFP